MHKLLPIAALAVGVLLPGTVAAATHSTWSSQADHVCTVFTAKAKKEFAAPVTPAGLYKFAVKAKALESREYAQLAAIPNRPAAGTKALAALKADIAEIGSAIAAADRNDQASFVRILKAYLNDHRAKAAFAAAGASKCG